MNEGCSPCACNVPGACEQLYFPNFLLPGAIVLGIVLLVLLLLRQKKIIKVRLKTLFIIWLVLVFCFVGLVALQTETGFNLTHKAAEYCQISHNPTCEY